MFSATVISGGRQVPRRRERQRQEHAHPRSSPASTRRRPAPAPTISAKASAPTPQLCASPQGRGGDLAGQDLALFPEMTVAENIAFDGLVGAPRLVNYRAIRGPARAALGKLGVELNLSAPLKSLSISGRQLVAIARALASDAKLSFMDEPAASLTQTETDHLLAVVRTPCPRLCAPWFLLSHRLAEVLDVWSRPIFCATDGWCVRRRGHDPVAVRRKLMTGKHGKPGRSPPATSAMRPIVIKTSGLTREGEYSDVNLTLRAGEGRQSHRLDRRPPHRTRAYAVRHVARRGWLGPPGSARRLREQSRSHRRRNRLRLRRDPLRRWVWCSRNPCANTVITMLKAITGAGGFIRQAKKSADKGVSEFAIKIGAFRKTPCRRCRAAIAAARRDLQDQFVGSPNASSPS